MRRQWFQDRVGKRQLLLLPLAAFVACSDAGSGARTDETTGTSTQRATSADTSAATTATDKSAGTSRRVVILGTSLTAGLGLDPDEAYPSLLQRKVDSAGFNFDVVNAGLSGETSAGALRRVGWVLDQPAAAVVLEVGANDGLRGVDPDSTYANLKAIIAQVRQMQPTARVMLVQMEAPTNLGVDYTTRFHDAYVRAAREAGIPLLPFLLEGVAGVARLNQADGIHPNTLGSQRVADTIWKALLPQLRQIAGVAPNS